MKRAIFIDKDGTLIEDVPYNVDPARIRLMSGAGEALRRMQAAGFEIIVVSNQPGVALGLFEERALEGVSLRIEELLLAFGVRLSGFLYCPHHPEGMLRELAIHCACRKPEPGLLLRAARQRGIDPRLSWMVGDILHDVEAGHRAGCRAILIENGNETEWDLSGLRTPYRSVPDLRAAADAILTEVRPV